MRISEIQIDRFGAWHDLTLSMGDSPASVLYGPNEAGKSTLLQFLRGVLYGFSPRLTDADPDVLPCGPRAGSLLIENGSGRHRVHRAAVGATRGNACLIGEESSRPADELLA